MLISDIINKVILATGYTRDIILICTTIVKLSGNL